jgi:Sporulation and spore germination
MPRAMKIVIGVLVVAVLIGLLSFRGLHRRMQRLAESQAADEKARHEVLAPPISTPTDVTINAKIFWAAGADRVAPVQVQLPLSADPVQRSWQLLHELTVNPPTPGQRTLPADTVLLGFYILPDGTAIADFSDALSSEMPSGILSEEMAVNSIARTLESNVPILRRLKILIHGQEVDTLAGNLDLTGFFDLNPPGALAAAPGASSPH